MVEGNAAKEIVRRMLCLALGVTALMPGPVRSDEDRGVRVLSAEEAGVVDYDPKRCHALLIAIDDYVDGSGWNDLHCAVRDAEAIGRLLRDEYGFGSVRLLKNEKATRRNILRMLDHYMSLGESDCLVIYYAGHGWMDPQSRSGYWVPADARQGDKYEYVSNSQTIGDYFKRYKAKHLLVLADSCFAGTLLRGAPEPRHEEWTIPSGFQKRSRWIVASGDLSPVPDDGGMGHSPFAQVIIDYLKVGDQSVFGVLDLHTYVRKQLAAAGRQDPVADHLPPPAHVPGGEFVFCRVGKNPPPPPPPPVVGRLEVTSNRDGTVFIDDLQPYPIFAGKRLAWERLPVGKHRVRVFSDGETHVDQATVSPRRTALVDAVFEDKPPPPSSRSWHVVIHAGAYAHVHGAGPLGQVEIQIGRFGLWGTQTGNTSIGAGFRYYLSDASSSHYDCIQPLLSGTKCGIG